MSRYSSATAPNEEASPLLSTQPYSGDSSSSRQHAPSENDIELDDLAETHYDTSDADLQFGGTEARERLEKSLLRKLDLRMSILVVIYILNYIDRNNAAAARLRGFEEDLNLEGSQFASIVSVLYVGYILMQIPSNIFLSRISKPSIYLPCCMVAWGAVSFLTGFTTHYYGALFARFVLGFVEAAFFPGALYLIARWYKRQELSQRTAFFTCGSLISNAFGSLIASGILDMMDGVFGYAAWRWLFFVEGGITVLVAILALFILPDYPENGTIAWLTPAEHAFAKWRMVEDNGGLSATKPTTESGDGNPKSNHALSGLILAVTDWKVWYLAVSLFCYALCLSFHLYFPTLTATMGYDAIVSLLLCVPPWMAATAWALWLSRRSDKTGDRCMHIVASLTIGIVGFLLAMSTMNIAVRYFSLFLMAQTFAGFIVFLAWASSTVSNPPTKRAAAIAFINTISQMGNIVGAYAWVKSWGPSYNKSYTICIASAAACALMCLWLRAQLRRMNSDMDQEDERHGRLANTSGKKWRYHT